MCLQSDVAGTKMDHNVRDNLSEPFLFQDKFQSDYSTP